MSTDEEIQESPEQESESGILDFDDAYQAARSEHPESGSEEEVEATEEVEETDESEEATAPDEGQAEEPEFIAWAKKVQGNVDEAGNLIPESLAKQAHELNKSFQEKSQLLAELQGVLKDPDVLQAVQRKLYGTPEQPKKEEPQEPQAEKTPEETIKEWIKEQMEEAVSPLQQQNQMFWQQYRASQINEARSNLAQQFPEDSDIPFKEIWPDVEKTFAQAAQTSGMRVDQLVDQLIQTGNQQGSNLLYQTLENVAKNVAFERLRQVSQKKDTQIVNTKKKANLSKKGTPSTKVNPKEREPQTFEEAFELAKQQLQS